ncbi:MAG: response regulator [Rhodoferax sp.]|nr:response regulator [Rhodoferax sp.]
MSSDHRILIATDVTGDAELVRRMLANEFSHVDKSVDPDKAVQDFDSLRPNVLILAFNSLDKAETYYLGLYRLGKQVHALEHRTIILCNKDDLHRVYGLCRKQYFDDYVLFWPMGHDAPRLPMAVHHALRQLDASAATGPSVAEFASQARKLAGLQLQLEQYMERGTEHIDHARDALQSGTQAASGLDGLASRLHRGELGSMVEVKDAPGLQREINQLKAMELVAFNKTIESAVEPVRGWANDLKGALSPGLESIHKLQALVKRVRPLVLLVDDDEFQHKLLRRLLQEAGCDLMSAMTGTEAQTVLRSRLPDLIVMDVQLPDTDGITLTRRIRATERFAAIPVLMITGQSDKGVVVKSIQAGAAGFLVKPFNKDLLLAKISANLRGAESPSGAD